MKGLGLVLVFVALPGLDQEGAGLGLGHLLGVLQVGQVIVGFFELLLGFSQVDDGLGQVGAGGVLQIIDRLLGADELELGGGVGGVGLAAEADEGLAGFHRLALTHEQLADHAAGVEGDLGVADGFQPAFGDDRAVGQHRWDRLRRRRSRSPCSGTGGC